MRISIKADFQTDGDYCILNFENYKNSPLDTSINSGNTKVNVCSIAIHFDYNYILTKVFDCDNVDHCKMYARLFLKELLCNISVLSSHYYLIKDFYELFDNGIKSLNKNENYYETISGNYEGTNLVISIEE